MDVIEVKRWYDSYVADFAALGRGDSQDVQRVLAYYGVPMLLSTDGATTLLAEESQVIAFAQQQIDGMRCDGYDRSDELDAETTSFNASCAMHRGRFSRRRADDTEITEIEASYLITDGPGGRRISALILHSAR